MAKRKVNQPVRRAKSAKMETGALKAVKKTVRGIAGKFMKPPKKMLLERARKKK